MGLPVVPLHVGSDHPALLALTLVLAFGPFLVLGAVIWRRRRLEGGLADGDPEARDADDPAQRER